MVRGQVAVERRKTTWGFFTSLQQVRVHPGRGLAIGGAPLFAHRRYPRIDGVGSNAQFAGNLLRRLVLEQQVENLRLLGGEVAKDVSWIAIHHCHRTWFVPWYAGFISR